MPEPLTPAVVAEDGGEVLDGEFVVYEIHQSALYVQGSRYLSDDGVLRLASFDSTQTLTSYDSQLGFRASGELAHKWAPDELNAVGGLAYRRATQPQVTYDMLLDALSCEVQPDVFLVGAGLSGVFHVRVGDRICNARAEHTKAEFLDEIAAKSPQDEVLDCDPLTMWEDKVASLSDG